MFAQVGLTPGHETGRRRVDTRARRSGEKAGDVRKKSTSFGLLCLARECLALCALLGDWRSREPIKSIFQGRSKADHRTKSIL
jgi:hypothetical protein